MAHYITTHNSKAEAVYSDKVPSDRVQFPTPIGTMELIATTHSSPVDVSTDSDIDQFAHDRENGIGTRMFPENGTAVRILLSTFLRQALIIPNKFRLHGLTSNPPAKVQCTGH